ncbi:uncharacterized protein LOC134196852 [Corticium candelabrum]|uniref:uncharacterized protein LOC134196852 n=1 Tax=Corticium candelabrum TaxID=121492 RepID=UPI002E26CFEB|nr:uncharacterized protein LOC134196852 [Corticium candelabrum]
MAIKKKYVIDRSTHELSDNEITILSLGLTFIPSTTYHRKNAISNEFNRYARTMRLKEYFRTNDRQQNKFRTKSDWEPPADHANRIPDLDKYLELTRRDLQSIPRQHTTDNLTPELRQTLKQLQHREEIIIKRADKWSGTVIEDKKTYIRDCSDLLTDKKTYEETEHDHRWETYHLIQELSFDAYANRVIDRNIHKFLLQQFNTIKTAEFYGLRKIHKTPATLRPIIAGHSSPTTRLSRVLDHYLQPIVATSKSYVRDSKQFIQIIDNTTLPKDTLLIAADVTSLCTSIPQQEGIDTVCKAMDTHYQDSWLTAFTREGLRIILKENYFQFTDRTYRQIYGTAMGTPVAPSFANIFMTNLETTFMENETTRPTHWYRYIDDIFLTWIQDPET